MILVVVLISTSLIANDVEHCFMCLLDICISSLEKNVYSEHLPFFWPHRILVPQSRTEPMTLAVEVQSLNHPTSKEFPIGPFLVGLFIFS